MFGGAIGGGKTEILLRWLAEGVRIPHYSGLFLVRTKPQLVGTPTTPVERSFRFFLRLGGIYNASKYTWTFRNGAMVSFGSMNHENDKHKFDGREYHRCVFDQVEQFSETQYTYMFSRLRRLKTYPIPCGMRSAANPVGGLWVKRRFVTPEAIAGLRGLTATDPSPPGLKFKAPNGAIFIPSRIADNPSLAIDEYIARLQSKLGANLAARLCNGDWSVVEGAIVNADDLRYYNLAGDALIPLKADGERLSKDMPSTALRSGTRWFATLDTAGTTKQKAAEKKGKAASWSCLAIWEYEPDRKFLYLRHMMRDRLGFVDLVKRVDETMTAWNKTRRLVIENAHFGQAVWESLRNRSYNCELSPTVFEGQKETKGESAKHERAIASSLLGMIADAQFYLPNIETVAGVAKWLPDFETELLGWTGLPDEVADQIDVASHAAYDCKRQTQSWGGVIR
jgi:phage terminase large subunit-like protein